MNSRTKPVGARSFSITALHRRRTVQTKGRHKRPAVEERTQDYG
jgi:hypothetical protein